MQNEILHLGKRIIVDASPVVLSYHPDENWRESYIAGLNGGYGEERNRTFPEGRTVRFDTVVSL